MLITLASFADLGALCEKYDSQEKFRAKTAKTRKDAKLVMAEDYVEFHARSAFSFLEGSSLPEELISVCANLGGKAMTLLDRDGVYGTPRFHMAAKKTGIKAHIGSEITLALGNDATHIAVLD